MAALDAFVLLSQDELDEKSHHHSRTFYDPLIEGVIGT